MVNGVNTSSDLNWILTRNNSSFLMKRRGVSHHFSSDPLNPKGLYKPRFQGTIQKRAACVQDAPSGQGVVLVYKKKSKQNKPGQSLNRVVLKRNARRTVRSIKQCANKQQYRTDLKNVSHC